VKPKSKKRFQGRGGTIIKLDDDLSIPKPEILNVDDPSMVLFQGPAAGPNFQTMEIMWVRDGATGKADKLFGRRVQDVKADFEKVSVQINEILSTAFAQPPSGLHVDSVEVALGFSAKGRLAFIAEAGVEATVTVTFKKS
jgi:hypothetical protein